MAREKICGIYKIGNKINGKVYIGQSNDIYQRWTIHKNLLQDQRHHNMYLQNAWNKYSSENFIFTIVEECSVDNLDEREVFWIEYYNSYHHGYNLTLGGGGRRGCVGNTTQVVLMNTGQIFDSLKDAAQHMGVWHTTISKCCRGESETGGRNPITGEYYYWRYATDVGEDDLQNFVARKYTVHNMRAVTLLNTGELFQSINEAAIKYHIQDSSIIECAKGRYQYAGRDPLTKEPLFWKYSDEVTLEDFKKLPNPRVTNSLSVILLNTLEVFDSISNAANTYNVDPSGISACCRNKQSHAGRDPITKLPLYWMYYIDFINQSCSASDIIIQRQRCQRSHAVILLNTMQVFPTVSEVVRIFHIGKSALISCCRNERDSAGKHSETGEPLRWAYYDEYLAAN